MGKLRGSLASIGVALFFTVVSGGCSNSGDFPADLAGQWSSPAAAVLAACIPSGILSSAEEFPLQQVGDVVTASFVDAAGNSVILDATYIEGFLRGTLEVRISGGRVIVASLGLFGTIGYDGTPMLDGVATITQDSDALCIGERVGVWWMEGPQVDPPTGTGLIVFAGHGYSEDVDVIDLDTMTVIATIPNAGGYRMVITPDGRKLYGTTGDNNFTITDAVNYVLLQSIDPSDVFTQFNSNELEPIAISPDGSRVYIGDESRDTALFTLRTSDDTLIDAVALVADEPENAVVSPDGLFLYIADNGEILKIDTATLVIVDRQAVHRDSHGVAISADGAFVYADGVSSGIDVIRTSDMTLVTNIAGGEGYFLKTSADGRWVYGVDEGSAFHIIDTSDNSIVTLDLNGLGLPSTINAGRGITTTADSTIILIASGGNGTTSGGLIKLDAETLEPLGFLPGRYQSVVVRPPITLTQQE